MDRLHVTRSYAAPVQSSLHCVPRPTSADPAILLKPWIWKLD
jgi:hypothetical protein